MKKFLALCTSVILGLGLSLAGVTAASATQETCADGGDWTKINVNALSTTLNAPAGKLIVETCYKASTTVIYADVVPAAASVVVASTVLNKPAGEPGSSIQNISHASYRVVSEATAAVSVSDPTCELGSSVTPGATSNASFGSVVMDGLDYTLVATATGTALFAAGPGVSGDQTTKTFTGTLVGPDTSLCEEEPDVASASISISDPTCELGSAVIKGSTENATFGDVELVGLNYTLVATATGTALFAAGPGVSGDQTTKTFTGTLVGPDTSLCEEEPDVASASISISDPTCELGSAVIKGSTENATFGDVELVGLNYTLVATATGDALFPAGAGVSGDRTTKTFTGTLEGIGEGLECLATLDTDPEYSTCGLVRQVAGFDTWIRVDFVDNVQYKIDGVIVIAEYTEVTPGPHTVTAEGINGYTLDPQALVEWNYNVQDSSLDCIPTLGQHEAGATATDPTCSVASGYLSFHRLPDEIGLVEYFVDGVSVGTTVTKLNKAPGNYVVTAAAVDPESTITPPGPWNLTITAFTGECLPTLAFTGAETDQPLQLAGGMVMLGLLGLYLRRRMVLAEGRRMIVTAK